LGLFALTGSALGFHVVGVESSSDRYAESIAIARALFRDNGRSPTIVQAYSEALPLPDASADMVASFQTLEHVGDLERTLCEIRRILKPGGLFFAQAPNYTSFYEAHYGVLAPLAFGKAWMRLALRLYRRPTGFLDHLQWLDPRRLRVLLCEIGFSDVQVGPIAKPTPSAEPLPARADGSPFQFRRGAHAQRLANQLALAYQVLTHSADRYSQIEVWAIA
jgi:SAM-dependent methyltransferase